MRRNPLAEALVDAGQIAFGTRAALADWLGSHRSQIMRVAEGHTLGTEAGWRLTSLSAVVMVLLALYEPDVVADWLHGNNPHLSHRRPVDVLASGDVASVMSAVQAARTGTFA